MKITLLKVVRDYMYCVVLRTFNCAVTRSAHVACFEEVLIVMDMPQICLRYQ